MAILNSIKSVLNIVNTSDSKQEPDDKYDFYCTDLRQNFVLQTRHLDDHYGYVYYLIVLSFIFSTLHALVLIKCEAVFRSSTMQLHLTLSIFESAYFCNLLLSAVTCDLHLPQLLA